VQRFENFQTNPIDRGGRGYKIILGGTIWLEKLYVGVWEGVFLPKYPLAHHLEF
jgi:hypothetical protein